ncbi:TylF/MycF/NovP-related O-methyltransferase, partial [Planctomycetota bacterium]
LRRGFVALQFARMSGALESVDSFSFVNLDVDLYQCTSDALKFFYPRVSRGGMMLSHDYLYTPAPGVKQAFDEFFADKPESVIPLWDTQCLVVKL